jgi:hypothetical protein
METPNIHALSRIRTYELTSEAAKKVHALELSATVTGNNSNNNKNKFL